MITLVSEATKVTITVHNKNIANTFSWVVLKSYEPLKNNVILYLERTGLKSYI